MEVQKREIVDLMAQVAEMESLKMRLTSEEEKYSASNLTVDRLKVKNLRFILSLNINVAFVRRPSIVFFPTFRTSFEPLRCLKFKIRNCLFFPALLL